MSPNKGGALGFDVISKKKRLRWVFKSVTGAVPSSATRGRFAKADWRCLWFSSDGQEEKVLNVTTSNTLARFAESAGGFGAESLSYRLQMAGRRDFLLSSCLNKAPRSFDHNPVIPV